jgi:hypothetical protein
MEDTSGACSGAAGSCSAEAGRTSNGYSAANGSTLYTPGTSSDCAPGAKGGTTGSTKARSLAKTAETPCAGH